MFSACETTSHYRSSHHKYRTKEKKTVNNKISEQKHNFCILTWHETHFYLSPTQHKPHRQHYQGLSRGHTQRLRTAHEKQRQKSFLMLCNYRRLLCCCYCVTKWYKNSPYWPKLRWTQAETDTTKASKSGKLSPHFLSLQESITKLARGRRKSISLIFYCPKRKLIYVYCLCLNSFNGHDDKFSRVALFQPSLTIINSSFLL